MDFNEFTLRKLVMAGIVFLPISLFAAEGGMSNYIPGFYGDLALAVAPPEGVSMRNDIFYYSGDASGTVRSTQLELDVDVTLLFDYLTFVYNPGIELFGGSLVFGATAVAGNADIDATIASGVRRDKAALSCG